VDTRMEKVKKLSSLLKEARQLSRELVESIREDQLGLSSDAEYDLAQNAVWDLVYLNAEISRVLGPSEDSVGLDSVVEYLDCRKSS